MQTPKELQEKIQALEAEKAKLATEVYGLRKEAEAKVAFLEREVRQMREDVKSLRELAGT